MCERILTDYAFKVDWAHRDVTKAQMVQRIEEVYRLNSLPMNYRAFSAWRLFFPRTRVRILLVGWCLIGG